MGRHKKTQKEFEEEVYELEGGEYTVLGEYTGANDKVKMKHNKCGNIYKVRPSSFLSGSRCPECMNKKASEKISKTHKEFLEEVEELVGNKYTILGQYTRSSDTIKIKHNECGHIWEPLAKSFLQGSRCPECFGNKRKSHEEFIKEVKDLVGNKYIVLEEYVNVRTKIKFQHKKCGHVYKVKPHDFLQGSRCPKCFGTKKKTQEQFEQEVYNKVGNEYTVLGEYKNNRTKIKIRHEACEETYMARPDHFLSDGRRCPHCNTNVSYEVLVNGKSHKQFENEIKEEGNGEYEVLGEYENMETKIKLKHNKCGYTWQVQPKSFIYSGTRCPQCSRGKSHEQFIKEVEKITDGEYSVLDEYTAYNEEIRFKHNECGYTFKTTPHNFKHRTNKCPNCYNIDGMKSHDKFVKEVKEKGNKEYKALDKYNGVDGRVTFKHKPCGTTFTVKAGYFLYQGKRCPHCTKRTRSKGEKKIKQFLDNHNIKYKRDYSFDDCRHDNKLRYDFVLFTDSNYGSLFKDKVTYLIEYNGIQHYEAIEYFGGQERLEHQKEHDKVKKGYAKDNDIPLLVIKYTEKEDIEDTLTSKLL